MPTADDFRFELQAQLQRAEALGLSYADVTSGNLHRDIGDYPDPMRHRMKTCCDVMRQARKGHDEILAQPPRGNGASLTIRYYLPR